MIHMPKMPTMVHLHQSNHAKKICNCTSIAQQKKKSLNLTSQADKNHSKREFVMNTSPKPFKTHESAGNGKK